MNEPRQIEKVEIVEPLRGIAAFAVMWFHFTHASNLFATSGGVGAWIKASGTHGGLGVEVFFVISGFILPYSMYQRGYQLGNFATFVAKRIVRLDPPYLFNVALSLALWVAVSQVFNFRGERFTFEPIRFLLHLGYLNALVGHGWYNPVFWTLAIEFQYYLLLAVVFPLLIDHRFVVRAVFPLLLAASAFLLPQDNLIVFWLGLFASGMAAFQFYCRILPGWLFAAQLAAITALNFFALGGLISLVGTATALAIALVHLPRIRPLSFLGMISYSLYLIHWPIGSRFINLGARIADTDLARILVLACAIVITVWLAFLLYKWIERPAQRWSSAMRYRKASSEAQPCRVKEA